MRTYPYLISRNELILTVHQCEACKKLANYSIKYELNESMIDVSHIFLCNDHEKLARFGNWTQVFKDVNLKIDGNIYAPDPQKLKEYCEASCRIDDEFRAASKSFRDKAGDRR